VAIGALYNDSNGDASGSLRVFKLEDGTWNQMGKDIDGKGSRDYAGRSVGISGDGIIIAVGAARGAPFNGGYVRIFEFMFGAWQQLGSDLNAEGVLDFLGFFLELLTDGSIVALGGFQNDGNGLNSGHLRIFEWTNEVCYTNLRLDE
jgi:hypothetical protein